MKQGTTAMVATGTTTTGTTTMTAATMTETMATTEPLPIEQAGRRAATIARGGPPLRSVTRGVGGPVTGRRPIEGRRPRGV